VYLSSIYYKGGIISFSYQTNPNTPPASPINPNVRGTVSMDQLLQSITVAYSVDGKNVGATQRTYSFIYSNDKLTNVNLTAA
jgi:hypothetical protein